MHLAKTLSNLGLTDKQSAVYLSCLQNGEASVLSIAKGACLKRPSVYGILDELEQLGLVHTVTRGKKTFYQAVHPEKIVSGIAEKLSAAQKILPSLEAMYNLNPEKPRIRIAETVAEVKEVYNGIFTYLREHPTEELLIFGSLKDAVENFQSSVVDYFYDVMKESHNPIREIGNDDTETRQYYHRSVKLNPRHEIRLIRDEGAFSHADNMLYGNTLVMFSVKKEIFALVIESPGIATTYRTLFSMAWRSGKIL